MAYTLNHIHFKTPDPEATAKWYVDNLGAKMVNHNNAIGGYKIDLHGMPVNITKFIDTQKHKQVYGFEHIAIDTDDLEATIAKLTANGAKILEKLSGPGRRDTYFVEGPQGVILELVEKPKTAGTP